MIRRLTLVACLLALAQPALAQPALAPQATPPSAARHPDSGLPLVRNYLPDEYEGGSQNWVIVQDHRGLIYVGSTGAVLEYDGATWRGIRTANRSTARSLAIDDTGRIYVGAVNELGYLAPNAQGEMEYVSLKDRIPEDAREFGDVWRLFATPDGVFFQTEAAIYRWANEAMTVLRPTLRFHRSSWVNGRLYAGEPGIGLTVLEGDTFVPLRGTERLGTEVYPVLLPYDEGRLLVGTRVDGLFLYDGTTLTPFPTSLDAFWRASQIYRAIALDNGTYVVTTLDGGVALIDRTGEPLQVLDRRSGLATERVYYAMADRDGAIWLAMEFGLARIEVPSPVSFFGEGEGIPVGAQDILRHQGRIYTVDGRGARYLRPAASAAEGARFETVAGIRNQTWGLLSIDAPGAARPPELLVANADGLYRIVGDRAFPIREAVGGDFRVAALLRSRVDPDRVWVSLFDGLSSMRWQGAGWVDEGRVAGVTGSIRSLAEDDDGTVWGGTESNGVVQVRFAGPLTAGAPRPSQASVRRFGEADGLPVGGMVTQHLAGRTYFLVGDDQPKFFVHDATSDTLVEDGTFDQIPRPEFIGGGNRIARPGPDGALYVNFGRGTVVMRPQASGGFELDARTFGRLADLGAANALHMDPDGVAWFANGGRIFRFDTTWRDSGEAASPPALIRRVTRGQETVLYGGGPTVPSSLRLDASSTEMRFEFSVPRFPFGSESATEYRSLLEGLDQEWSAWSRDARRDYTNLSFGDYRFRVQGRSPGGRESAEAVYAFVILPPWYLTWWAYALYGILATLALAGSGQLYRRRVVAKERQRAQFAEARLRAEAAETLARSESAGKKQVELLSDIGREITSSLEFEAIFDTLYARVNELADADVFGVGLYHHDRHALEYRLAIEDGKRYAPYTRDTRDQNQLPVWCIEHREPVFINDLQAEYGTYLTHLDEQTRPLEDGTPSRQPQSLIYLPLLSKDRVLGVITIQSFESHAYTTHQLNMMRSLASFASVALDNANAYRQLNDQDHEIRRLLEEARHARAIAEEADAAKSSFLSTVSHELRTPLTSVLGFAKIIRKRLEDRIFPLVPVGDPKVAQTIRQVEENLGVVVSEGERLTKLIDDVLDLAKIEAGKLEWQMEAVSVADVVARATAATSSLLDQKGLRLIVEVADELPPLTADRDRLIQVVINLISNAVKFTDTGSVTCRALRHDGTIVVSVIDTGVGIAPADQPKVFERFKQVGDTLTDKPKGTGLGLPICREIVEHHGGRIWMESAPGQGSTFSFSLPVSADARAAGPLDLAALVRQLRDHVVVTSPRRLERESHILVVDDDPNIRELLTQEFVEAGYVVEVAANGREAIAAVRRRRPDLIVLDVMMPEMNGFDVAAVLKNDPDTMDIPIVILSIVQDRERGFRLGVDRYLTKPIDTDLLFREVGALLEQRKSHKRVLVVDEDAPTVRTLTDVLKTRGYSVSEASAADLVEKAKTLQPDIIMLNSATPNPESVQLLRFEKGLENVLFLVYR